jgi:hypothetical protein
MTLEHLSTDSTDCVSAERMKRERNYNSNHGISQQRTQTTENFDTHRKSLNGHAKKRCNGRAKIFSFSKNENSKK